MYAPAPSKQDVSLYGGDIGDYMPVIELAPDIIDSYNLFADLETQWKISPAGGVTGLDYSAIPFVMEAHGLTNTKQVFADIRIMESAARSTINKRV